jgi:hypothetical protein
VDPIYDVSQKPEQAYYSLQSELAIAAKGAPNRVHTYTPPVTTPIS